MHQNETKIVCLISYSWMYHIERSLRTLKQYVRNKARPEGSIAESYMKNESGAFCSGYLTGIESQFNIDERNDDNILDDEVMCEFKVFIQKVRPLGVSNVLTLSQE